MTSKPFYILLMLYIIEVITQHKKVTGITDSYNYQITWEGYDEIPWESAFNFSNAKPILECNTNNADWKK